MVLINSVIWINHSANDTSLVTIKVRGSLVAHWVLLLEVQCDALLRSGKKILLDLCAMTEVDARGIAVLRRLASDHLRIVRGLTGPRFADRGRRPRLDFRNEAA